jgi:hypothetical protein
VRLDHGLGLPVQLVHGALAGAGDGLVGGHDHPLDPDAVEDRAERHHRLHGRAVGVRDDAAVVLEGVGVHLGDHQGHVVGHAPLGGVVDDCCAGFDETWGPFGARLGAGAEQRQVEALDGVFIEGNHGQVRVAMVDGSAR